MAAGEDQPELVVRDRVHLVLHGREQRAGRAAASNAASRASAGAFSANRRARRTRSIARLRAVVVIQAPAFAGTPVDRPPLERRDVGVRDRLLGEVEVAEDADQGRDDPPVLLAEDAGDGVAGVAQASARDVRRSAELHDRPDLDPARPGAGDARGRVDRRVEVRRLDQVVAAEVLLGLGERPVGDDPPAVADGDRRGVDDGLERLAAQVLPARPQPVAVGGVLRASSPPLRLGRGMAGGSL